LTLGKGVGEMHLRNGRGSGRQEVRNKSIFI
jgi:hypothetical protein